jgi:hypothetical protein
MSEKEIESMEWKHSPGGERLSRRRALQLLAGGAVLIGSSPRLLKEALGQKPKRAHTPA